ncbi:hypothetical protein [Bifidobacterium santillanense]|nr:hypothetical protein [Bifidobacterium santillanense]
MPAMQKLSAFSTKGHAAARQFPGKPIMFAIFLFLFVIVVVALFNAGQGSGTLGKAMYACQQRVDSSVWSREVEGDYRYFELSDRGNTLTVEGLSDPNDAILNCVTDQLDMPQSVWSKILHTRPLDGTLTDEWDHMKITWSYQADNGLNIVFEKK